MQLLKTLPLVASLSIIFSLTGCEKNNHELNEENTPLTSTKPVEKVDVAPLQNEIPNSAPRSNGWDKVEGWDIVRAYIQKDITKNEPIPMTQSNSGVLLSKAPEIFTPCITNLSDKHLMVSTSIQGFNNNLRMAEKNTLLHTLQPKSTRCFSPYNLNLKAPLAMGWMVYEAELKEDSEIPSSTQPIAYGVLHLGDSIQIEELKLWGQEYPQYDPNNVDDKRKEQEMKNKAETENKAKQETVSLKDAVENKTQETK